MNLKISFKKFLSMIVIFILFLSFPFRVSLATNPSTDDPDTEDTTDEEPETLSDSSYSFYKISSAASSYLSDETSPSGKEFADSEIFTSVFKTSNGSDVSKAAGLLGYVDDQKTESKGWLESKLTQGTISRDTDALKANKAASGVSTSNNAFAAYIRFGSALNALGLDQTSNGAGTILRTIAGFFVMVFYLLALGVNILFKFIVTVLQVFNPFRLMVPFFTAQGMEHEVEGVPEAFTTIADTISDLFSLLYNASWSITLPASMGFLIVTFLMFYDKEKARGRVKRALIRMFFLAIGLPLFGSLYTGALEQLKDIGASGSGISEGIDYAVMGTFFDFESWVSERNMNMPEGVKITYDAAKSGEGIASLRKTTLLLNSQKYGFLDPSRLGSSIDDWNNINSIGEKSDSSNFSQVYNMISRYSNGNVYTASQYEGAYKRKLRSAGYEADDIDKWFKEASDPKKYNKISSENPLFGSQGMKLVSESGCTVFRVEGDASNGADTLLGPIGTYNYLNTTFAGESITTYSTEKAVSLQTRETHYSVNLVGRGLIKFLYFINLVAILASIAILGLFFAYGVVVGVVMKGIKVIINAVPALLGSIRGIGKVIMYSIVMLIETLGSIMLFSLVQSILLSFGGIMSMNVMDQASNTVMLGLPMIVGVKMDGILNNQIIQVIALIISTIIPVGFTVKAISLRGSIMTALESAIEESLSKVLQTDINAVGPEGDKSGGLGKALGVGVGAVGLAGAKSAYDAYKNKGDKSEDGDSVEGEAEDDKNKDEAGSSGGDYVDDSVSTDPDDPDGSSGGAIEGSSEKKSLPPSDEDVGKEVIEQKALAPPKKTSDNDNTSDDDSESQSEGNSGGDYGDEGSSTESTSEIKSSGAKSGKKSKGKDKDSKSSKSSKDGDKSVQSDKEKKEDEGREISGAKSLGDTKKEKDNDSGSNNETDRGDEVDRDVNEQDDASEDTKALAAAMAVKAMGDDKLADEIAKAHGHEDGLDDKEIDEDTANYIRGANKKALSAVVGSKNADKIMNSKSDKEAYGKLSKALSANGMNSISDVVDKYNANAKANGLEEIDKDQFMSKFGNINEDNLAAVPSLLAATGLASNYSKGQANPFRGSDGPTFEARRGIGASAVSGMKDAAPDALKLAVATYLASSNSDFAKTMGNMMTYQVMSDFMTNSGSSGSSTNLTVATISDEKGIESVLQETSTSVGALSSLKGEDVKKALSGTNYNLKHYEYLLDVISEENGVEKVMKAGGKTASLMTDMLDKLCNSDEIQNADYLSIAQKQQLNKVRKRIKTLKKKESKKAFKPQKKKGKKSEKKADEDLDVLDL